TWLRWLLGLVAVSNGLVGLLGVLPGVPISKVATAYYSASVAADPQVEHIAEMFGAYMLAIGILAGFAALNPDRYRVVTYTVTGLLFLRVVQRVVFAGEQSEVFGISGFWYWGQTILFLLVATALLVFAVRASGGEESSAA
ncbi:MAG: hypothetical protein OEX97_12125, partial [Acidimicrobiia bacterium]|nr:hypothetical protein [Acidimicrobiia bacterium]